MGGMGGQKNKQAFAKKLCHYDITVLNIAGLWYRICLIADIPPYLCQFQHTIEA